MRLSIYSFTRQFTKGLRVLVGRCNSFLFYRRPMGRVPLDRRKRANPRVASESSICATQFPTTSLPPLFVNHRVFRSRPRSRNLTLVRVGGGSRRGEGEELCGRGDLLDSPTWVGRHQTSTREVRPSAPRVVRQAPGRPPTRLRLPGRVFLLRPSRRKGWGVGGCPGPRLRLRLCGDRVKWGPVLSSLKSLFSCFVSRPSPDVGGEMSSGIWRRREARLTSRRRSLCRRADAHGR